MFDEYRVITVVLSGHFRVRKCGTSLYCNFDNISIILRCTVDDFYREERSRLFFYCWSDLTHFRAGPTAIYDNTHTLNILLCSQCVCVVVYRGGSTISVKRIGSAMEDALTFVTVSLLNTCHVSFLALQLD